MKNQKTKIAKNLKADIDRFHRLRSEVLHQEYLSGNSEEIENSAIKVNDDEMAINYLKHVLKTGSSDDRREALGMIKTNFKLLNRKLDLMK
jgi:hypothetical protein